MQIDPSVTENNLEVKEKEKLYIVQKNYLEEGLSRYDMKLFQSKSQYQSSLSDKTRVLSLLLKDTKYQELLSIKKEQRNLESEINAIKFQNKKQSIVSPTDGFVAKMMINTIGGVVTPAEKLISIVPKDAQLIVKVNSFIFVDSEP